MVMMGKKNKTFNKLFYKEVILSSLAVISIALLTYETFMNPQPSTVRTIFYFDLIVAIIFLTDFSYMLFMAKNKSKYLRENWFLLLASIPLVDSWAEVLRGLRILALVRLIRAGEHLVYATRKTKN